MGDRGAVAARATRPPYGGRHRAIPDRNCFAAIVYMARTSTTWRLLPARELGCGSPATCWRRLTEWANAGVFDRLHLEVLDRLGGQGGLDWSRAGVDTMSVRAKRGGTRWAQIRSIVASPGPSCPWSARVAGCRLPSWLSCWRRLQVRWDRDSGRFFAFVLVACALVCFNRL